MKTAQMIAKARALLADARADMQSHDIARVLDCGELADMCHKAARKAIATARGWWAVVRARLAVTCPILRHTYTRAADGWRAVVTLDGATVWTSARVYGKRQSAQRAALRERGQMVIAAENAILGTAVA